MCRECVLDRLPRWRAGWRVEGERGGALQDYASGSVGFIPSTNWQLPTPWAPPAPRTAGHELFQWRFKSVNVTCARGGTAIERMAGLRRPARAAPDVAAAEAYCYHPDDRGESYRGRVAWSESGRPCVPWGRPGQPAGANVLSQQYLPDSCDALTVPAFMHGSHTWIDFFLHVFALCDGMFCVCVFRVKLCCDGPGSAAGCLE